MTTTPPTIAAIHESIRKVRQAAAQREMVDWIATLDQIPYTVTFLPADRRIWMKETKYYHAHIAFPTKADADEMSRVTGKPLVNLRDMPVKGFDV